MARAMILGSVLVLSVVLLLLQAGVSATSFNVVNHCSNTVGVQVAENPGPSIGTSGFSLTPGESRLLSPPSGWGGNIGSGTPGLLAEFSIGQAGVDYYDLSAVNGFFVGVGMSITGDGTSVTCSPTASTCPAPDLNGNTCTNPNRDDPNSSYAQNVRAACPTTISWSGDTTGKVFGVATGGTFTITFCP